LEQREADTGKYRNSERTSWSKENQIRECIRTQREPLGAKRSRYILVYELRENQLEQREADT
jgi:hypothetical protein